MIVEFTTFHTTYLLVLLVITCISHLILENNKINEDFKESEFDADETSIFTKLFMEMFLIRVVAIFECKSVKYEFMWY